MSLDKNYQHYAVIDGQQITLTLPATKGRKRYISENQLLTLTDPVSAQYLDDIIASGDYPHITSQLAKLDVNAADRLAKASAKAQGPMAIKGAFNSMAGGMQEVRTAEQLYSSEGILEVKKMLEEDNTPMQLMEEVQLRKADAKKFVEELKAREDKFKAAHNGKSPETIQLASTTTLEEMPKPTDGLSAEDQAQVLTAMQPTPETSDTAPTEKANSITFGKKE